MHVMGKKPMVTQNIPRWIIAYLEWNLFVDMLGLVHALNYVLVEMEGI